MDMTRPLLCVLVVAVSVFASPVAHSGSPTAKVEPYVTNYYGTPVTDDYRWMEEPGSKPLAEWMRAQDEITRSTINSIPGRRELLKEVSAASNLTSATAVPILAGDRYFYRQMQPGHNVAKLYMRDIETGIVTLLVDPSEFGPGNTSEAINFFQPSQDGQYVAYGVSADGSEDATLRVISTETLRDQGVAITRVQGENATFLPVWWLPNNNFAYYRRRNIKANDKLSNYFMKSRAWLHRLGQNPNGRGDKAIFGYAVDRAVPVAPDQDALVKTVRGSPYAFGLLTRNESNNVIDAIFVTPVKDLEAGKPIWKKVAGRRDDVTAFDAAGDVLFLLTYKGASHYKVIATNLAAPGPATYRTVFPQSDAVIRGFTVGKDGLYANSSLDGVSRLTRVALSGTTVVSSRPVVLPYAGTINALAAERTRSGVVFALESWTRSPLWYRFDSETGQTTDTGLQKPVDVTVYNLGSEEVKVVSYDGTMVPLSIIMKAGTRLDGRNPTLLIGYGSYGTTITPGFDPSALPWLNRGGIIAIPHVRGGGWYGEQWHKAGMGLTKLNTVFDYIACAQYLVDKHYTSPHYLAGKGISAGGIAIGGAITWRPGLFAAAIDGHGNTDTLRAQFTPNGPPNIEEFGSVTTVAGFHALYAMSAYAHVRDGVPYPAVLLETGAYDPRVASWIVNKMAARLQAATSSHNPILLRVSYDAGHGFGSTKAQGDAAVTDELTFLLWQMGMPTFQPEQRRLEAE